MPVSSVDAERARAAGRDVNLTWWYTYLSIAGMSVFLLAIAGSVSVALLSSTNAPSAQIVLVLALFMSTAVSCCYVSWLLKDGYGAGWPRLPVTALTLTAPVATWIVTGFIPETTLYGAMPLWVTLSILLALVVRRHRVPLLIVGLALVVLHGLLNPGTQTVLDAGQLFGLSLFIVLVPPTFVFSGWLWHLIRRLNEARAVSSQLAVARERLRFASDLHDIQGHHLQVIALKAELADRLLATQDPTHHATAQQAIGEVRALAEEAQSETRQLVRDLRVVSLEDELENARGVLEAAGVSTEVSVDDIAVASAMTESNRLLGFAVREATTNILRHSNATQVTITLTRNQGLNLQITNDGADNPVTNQTEHQGTGLAGLAHRFRQAGGSLECHRDQGLFHVHASLPDQLKGQRL